MAYPKQPDTCMYCPKPMARRENGRRRICQDCNRERKYLYQYGIDLIDYREMWESQGGLCGACNQPETALRADGTVRWLCVDHDHATGLVRGLLCYHCNQGVGHFKDNTEYLQGAIDDLIRTGKETAAAK